MNQDSVDRDRLLTRLDENVKYLVEGHKNTIQALVDHSKTDDVRFVNIDKTLKSINDRSILFYGKIYGGSAVVSAVALFLMKLFKIGG